MDTSDSECFESADESLQSDDENTTTVIARKVESLGLAASGSVEVKEDVSLEEISRGRVVCDRAVEETKERECKQTKEKVGEEAKEAECLLDGGGKSSVVCGRTVAETKDEPGEASKGAKETECLLGKRGKTSVVCDRTVAETKEEQCKESQEAKETDCLLEKRGKTSVVCDSTGAEINEKVVKTETVVESEEKEDNLWADDEGWGNLDDVDVDPTVYDNTQLPSDLKKGKLVSKYVPEEDKWEFDSWEPLNDEKPQQQDNPKSTWGGWSNWGVGSILSTATQGVTTLTSQVSQGLSNVLETGMGVPDPEELARMNRQDQIDNEHHENNNPSLSFGLGNLVSGVTQITKIAGVSQITKIVESTGSKVINSGLDTLETIGKKTMEVLQEGDPGLKKKRAFLQMNQDKPVLSQILREAKAKAEEENRVLEDKHYARKANYETIFDDCQGLVHLEALEMLSRQCDIKLQTVLETYTGDSLKEVQETMEQVKELCEIPDEEDEETLSREEIKTRLESAVSEIGISITYERLLSTWEETEDWLSKLNLNVCSERELHQQAIETLAQLTAIAVEQFHKSGELLLEKEHRSTADEADSLVQLTTTLTALIGVVAGKFSDKLNSLSATSQNKEEINSLITNIFLEAANSSSYIQDAFQLLIPVLQVGAI